MSSPTYPAVAHSYASKLALEKAAAIGSVAFHWKRMTLDFERSWPVVGRAVKKTMRQAQLEVGNLALDFTEQILPYTAPLNRGLTYTPDVSAFVGVAGDGRSVDGLADYALVHAREGIRKGATTQQALQSAGQWLTAAMGNVLADTHRGVEQMTGHSHKAGVYVRMVTGDYTCGRCLILAGREYRSSTAFERHPGCDCTHIPAAENIAGDMTTDPHVYLDTLSDDVLARTLGSKANAQAYKDGADLNQLINAYRKKGDVRKAQLWGRDVSYTIEGMTRYGSAFQRIKERHGAYRSGNTPVRLMPSTIYDMAKDRDDAIRLLHTYGWIL